MGGKVAEERPRRLPFLRPGQRKLAPAFCKRCNIRRIIPQRHKAEKSALPLSVGIFPARPLPSSRMDPTLSLDLVGEREGPSFLLSGLPVVCSRCRASLSSRGAGGSHTQLMTTHFLKLFSGRFRCDLGKAEGFFFFGFFAHVGFEAAALSLSCGHTGVQSSMQNAKPEGFLGKSLKIALTCIK